MQITLENLPARGAKAIIVDGLQWGSIHRERHGARGSSYWFKQVGLVGEIRDPQLKNRIIKVHNIGITAVPIDDRLLDKAINLIFVGLLRHPKTVEADQSARKAALQAQRAERDGKELDRFRAKAREAFPHAGEEWINITVDLMKWSQSQ